MVKLPSCAIIAIVSIMICAGCSVKENRGACPCRVILDYSEVDTSVVKTADLFMRSDDGFFFTHQADINDIRFGMEVSVPRTEMGLTVWSGTDNMLADSGLIIPMGHDCPEIYFYSSVLDTRHESVVENIIMTKNHCRMTINMNNVASAPKSLIVVGNVNGYLRDGSPSEGSFRYMMETGGGTGGVVVLPRQIDDSLKLEVIDGAGVLRRFNIGEYISESGYDWSRADLEDLTLEIDVTVTDIKLSIAGWEKVYKFDVII